MTSATHDDVIRLFPGMQDHTVLAVLATGATVDELDAAMLLLQDTDEGLIAIRHQEGSRIDLLLEILQESEIRPRDDFER
jgi:hypothetical protein